MRTFVLCLVLALATTTLAVPTAAAQPFCEPNNGGESFVNWFQENTDCTIDRTQVWLEDVVCDLICP